MTAELRPTGAINESAIFAPGYLVNFTERGLASGTNWSLSVAGRNYTTNGSSVYLLAANGTYGYRVAPVGDEIPHPMAGALVVNGTAPPPISIEFATPEVGYSVSFVETGLPLGANWSVVLRGVSHASTTPVIATVQPNGTYAYNVTPIPGYLAHPPRGGFIVSGANLSLAVLYTPIPTPRAVYGVTFAEDGLPAGATWSIAVRNVTVLSSGPDLTVFEPNGTYSFSVSTVPGFTSHPPNGGFFVNGTSPTAIAVNFTHTPTGSTAAFPVIWVETGLAPNVTWSVTVRHTLYTSTASYIVAAERDGNYTYNVTPIAGYFDRPQMGGFSVQGISPPLLPVTFQRAYQLTFSAVGLPVGSAWHVRVGVVWEGGSGSTLTLLVPTGNWSFIVVPPPHYNALPIQGSILVGNSSFNQTIIFALTIYEVDPTGVVISAALAEYRAILVGTVIAIAATAIFAVLGRRSGVEEGDHLTGPFPTGPGAVLSPGGPSAAAVQWTSTTLSPPRASATTTGGRSPDVAWGVSGLMA
ncbi:MAG TPA: hypothetical protein VGS18_00390, partial [Thermoplasmata archaeon]|nr:hypothetical protein [Thermoplasmata archaeon]